MRQTGEDLVNRGGNIGITHQLNPLDTITITGHQNYYFYEISQDVVETQGEWTFDMSFHRFSASASALHTTMTTGEMIPMKTVMMPA